MHLTQAPLLKIRRPHHDQQGARRQLTLSRRVSRFDGARRELSAEALESVRPIFREVRVSRSTNVEAYMGAQ